MSPIKQFLEFFTLATAVVAIFFGIRTLIGATLGLQKRAFIFLLGGLAFFLLYELFEVARLLNLLSDVQLIREFVGAGFVVCLGVALYILGQSEYKEVKVLSGRANTDALTGLYNHAYFQRAAQRRFEQARLYNIPLSLILLDIDDFKSYNDSFGHEAGNVVVSSLGQILRDSVRADDIVARYGGEEFVVLMSDKLEYAGTAAERIRISIQGQCAPKFDPRINRPVTVSLGVAHIKNEMVSVDELVEAADKQMYRAKFDGKNCVRIEDAV